MEDITLQLGESKIFSKEEYVGSEIIPLSRIVLSGGYSICGNIITRDGLVYELDFNGSITEVTTKLFGVSYFVNVEEEPLEIYLKTLEDIDILSFTFSVIRNA